MEAKKAPRNCAAAYTGNAIHGILPRVANAKETAGFKWPPERQEDKLH